MFFIKQLLIFCILFASSTAYADEVLRQRLQTCINSGLTEVLSGNLLATEAIDINLLTQRVLGRQHITLEQNQALQLLIRSLINEHFSRNDKRFTDAVATVYDRFTEQRGSYFVDGSISANGENYYYKTTLYFTSELTCKFYAINIENYFILKYWLKNHRQMENIFNNLGIRR